MNITIERQVLVLTTGIGIVLEMMDNGRYFENA